MGTPLDDAALDVIFRGARGAALTPCAAGRGTEVTLLIPRRMPRTAWNFDDGPILGLT